MRRHAQRAGTLKEQVKEVGTTTQAKRAVPAKPSGTGGRLPRRWHAPPEVGVGETAQPIAILCQYADMRAADRRNAGHRVQVGLIGETPLVGDMRLLGTYGSFVLPRRPNVQQVAARSPATIGWIGSILSASARATTKPIHGRAAR